jgi:anionic cell wall polymer biosynthesis LytR-Cps2A-Psr (LCP) family protein
MVRQNKFTILFALLITLMLFVSAGGCNKLINQPLAPTLAVATKEHTQAPTPTQPPVQNAPVPSPTPAGICGTTGKYSILMLGTGPNVRAGFQNETDFIRIVGANYNDKTLKVLTMNEDLELSTPKLEKYYITRSRIIAIYPEGAIFTLGTDLEQELGGVNTVAQTLYDNFAYKADYYILINEEPLVKMLDQIGGLDVPVSEAFAQTHQGYTAGTQHFDGAKTFDYSTRLDSGDTELERVQRQNQVFGILLKKVLNVAILPKIPDLITAFHDSIVTDMSIAQLANLACLFSKVPSDQISLQDIPPNMYTLNANGLLTPDTLKINQLIQDIIK